MNQIFDFISRKAKSVPALSLYSLFIAGFSLIYLVIFKYDGPWDWDDLTYLHSIFQERYFPILFGRAGFCYPFIAIWSLVQKISSTNFLFIEDLILISNLILQTLTYVFTFRLLIAAKIPVKVAFVAVLLLIAELSYTVLGSRYNDTPLMQFCVVLSYYLFLEAHERRQFKYLIGSGLVAGYAILAREPAVVYLIFFPVVYAWFKKRNLIFSRREYAVGLGVLTAVAVSGPVLLLLFYNGEYINTVMQTTPYYFAEARLFEKFELFWRTQINGLLVITGLCGLGLAFLKMKKTWIASVAFLCLAPVVVSYFLLEYEAAAEARFYFGMFLLLSLGSAFLITGIAEKIPNKKGSVVFKSIAILVLMISATEHYWSKYEKELGISRRFQEYYSEVSPLLNQRTTLIFGNETVYMRYRTTVEGQDAYIISAGFRWPKGHLSEIINRSLNDGRTVLYDPLGDGYNNMQREEDLKRMHEEFQITEIENGIFKVEKK